MIVRDFAENQCNMSDVKTKVRKCDYCEKDTYQTIRYFYPEGQEPLIWFCIVCKKENDFVKLKTKV